MNMSTVLLQFVGFMIQNDRLMALLATIGLMTAQAVSAAEPATSNPDSSRLTGEFAIGKDGRLLLLPVNVGGEEYLFMVDTGACRSGFDLSLRDKLGDPQGTQILQTPAGRTRVETFHWPVVTLNGREFKSARQVACIDLHDLRQGTNYPIFGVIGMDILRNCQMQIDFDHGIIRFLNLTSTRSQNLGEKVPVEFSDDHAPFLVGSLGEGEPIRLLIDTGAQGNSLNTQTFDRLFDGNRIRMGEGFVSVTVAGAVNGNRGRLDRLTIGPFSHKELRVARLNIDSIGLRYLSRFQVTFDFPEGCLYLKNGANPSRPEPRATSGMTLSWIDGAIRVDRVRKDGPAAKSGVRSNDVITQVNGIPASEYDHFALRELLTSEGGKHIPIRIARANHEMNVVLLLEDD